MENKTWNSAKILQFVAFTAMMIVMPALSWYYLRGGRNIRREAMAELTPLGKIPAFSAQNLKGDTVSELSLNHRIVIFNFPKNAKSELKTTVFEQFDNRNDIQFVSFYPDSLSEIQEMFRQRFPRGNEHWWPLTNSADFSKKIEAIAPDAILTENLFVLADTNNLIRRFYDGTNRSDMVRLVQQIALIMPSK
jgi:hypothetical protein